MLHGTLRFTHFGNRCAGESNRAVKTVEGSSSRELYPWRSGHDRRRNCAVTARAGGREPGERRITRTTMESPRSRDEVGGEFANAIICVWATTLTPIVPTCKGYRG